MYGADYGHVRYDYAVSSRMKASFTIVYERLASTWVHLVNIITEFSADRFRVYFMARL